MFDGTDSYRVYTGQEVVDALRVYADGFEVPDEGHPLKEMDSGCLKRARKLLKVPRKRIASALKVCEETVDNRLRDPCSLDADKASALLSYLAGEYAKSELYACTAAIRHMTALQGFCQRFVAVKYENEFRRQRRELMEMMDIFCLEMLLHVNEGDALAQLAATYIIDTGRERTPADVSPVAASAYKSLRGHNRNAELFFFANAQRELDGVDTPDPNGERWLLDDEAMNEYRRIAGRCLNEIETWVKLERELLGLDEAFYPLLSDSNSTQAAH